MSDNISIKDHIITDHHQAFFVSDLDESVKFYQDVFGFEVMYYGVVECANERLAMLKLKNMTLELLWVPTHTREELREKYMQVDHHFCFIVDDVRACREILLKHPGITAEEDRIRDVPGIGGMHLNVTFYRGLDGERFEIMENIDK